MAIEKIVNLRVNEIGMDSAIASTDKLADNLNEVEKSSLSVKTGMKESTNSVLENGGAMGLLNDATGGLAMTVKDAVEATALFAKESKIATFVQGAYTAVVGTSTGAMKTFKLALIGTGVGLFVVALGALIVNFDKVKKAVLTLIPGLASVGEFFGNLIDAVTDFIGVTSDASRAMDRMVESAKKSLELNKKFMQEHGDEIDEFTKRRIEAKDRYSQAIQEEGADEVALRKRLIREIKQIEKDREEDREKKRKEEAEKIKDAAEKAAAAEKARQDKIDAANKKRREEQIQEELAFNKFQAAIKFGNLDAEREYNEEMDAIRASNFANIMAEVDAIEADKKVIKDKEISDEQFVAKAKQEIQMATIDTAINGLSLLRSVFDKNKGLQKALLIAESAAGIAKIVINTQAANAGARLKYALIPGGAALAAAEIVLNKVNAGIGIAANIASTSKALSALGGGGAPSAGNIGSGGGSESTAPQFNIVGQNSNNQLAQSIGTQQQRPIEAFVVSGNVTNAQSLDRNRIKTATFGS